MTVHPSAAIAPGVLLKANSGARLIIEAGVSIGMGSILHVYEGTLTIATGACLGSSVLLVGSGKIGEKACIGSMTTLIDACVEAGQVIPSESLIGDSSRTVSSGDASASGPSSLSGAKATTLQTAAEIPVLQPSVPTVTSKAAVSEATPGLEVEASEASQPETSPSEIPPESAHLAQPPKVYGLERFNGLMTSLFPHRQSLNQPLQTTGELEQPSQIAEG